jgi:hypothetical protein
MDFSSGPLNNSGSQSVPPEGGGAWDGLDWAVLKFSRGIFLLYYMEFSSGIFYWGLGSLVEDFFIFYVTCNF